MAARKLRPYHVESTRAKIQVGVLVDLLHKHADGRDCENPMTATRLKAAEILLKKAVPDISSVEWTGELSGELKVKHDLSKLSTKELAAMRALLEKAKSD
jgi:hypothetical protein